MDVSTLLACILGVALVAASCWAIRRGFRDRRRLAMQESDYMADCYIEEIPFDRNDPLFVALDFMFLGAVWVSACYAFVWWQDGFSHLGWGWGDTCIIGMVPVLLALMYMVAVDPTVINKNSSGFWFFLGMVAVVSAIGYLVGQLIWPALVAAIVGFWCLIKWKQLTMALFSRPSRNPSR